MKIVNPSALFSLAAGFLLTACAPQDLKNQSSSSSTAGDSATTASTASAPRGTDPNTTGILQFAAQPPAAGFKLPFPDAMPAIEMKETGKRGGTMTVSTIGDPKTFDPITANESSSTQINGPMFVSLVTYDYDTQQYVPFLLKSLTVADDNKTWTATLRDGIKWSDGQPITADDIIFTSQVIYDPAIINPGKDVLQVADKPLKFEKIDNLSVRITPAEPTGFMHVMLASMQIIPRHTLEEAYKAGQYNSAMNVNADPAKLVVSGPFKLQQYQPGERVVLVRNEHYFRVDKNGERLPYLDSVVFSVAPDLDSMTAKFRSGQADMLDYPRPEMVPDLREAQEKESFTLHDSGPGNSTGHFWFNIKPGSNKDGKPYVRPELHTAFNNVKFRQAVYHAINRDGMIRTVLRGLAVKADSMVPVALKDWHAPNLTQYEFDVAKAKALLDELGYRDNNNDGIRELPDGQPLVFTFITNVENKTRVELGTIIATDLRAIGIQATPQHVDFNTLVTQLNDSFQYEACLLGFTGSIHPITSMNMWRSNGRTHTWNPLQETPATPWEARIDELTNQFAQALDFSTQQKTVFEMQQIFADNVPMLPLYSAKIFHCTRNRLGNIRPTPFADGPWNIDEIYIK